MNRRLLFVLLCVLFVLGTVVGCCSYKKADGVSGGIPFEYFYRGFTLIENKPLFLETGGISVILTDDDWHDFMDNYCPGIPYFINIDYNKECLIV